VARAGGYSRKKSDEYIGTTEASYAEAITSARSMGQTLEQWTVDAIAFHSYRCEQVSLREAYAQAELEARANNNPTPDPAKFRPTRPEPTITAPAAGKGSGPATGRSYRP
jgi:hypothetical protein